MASVRLTTHIRDALLKKLLVRAFQARGEAFVAKVGDFAVRVHHDAFSKDLKAMEALPEGWLPIADKIQIRFAADVAELTFSGCIDGYSLPENFRRAGITSGKGNSQSFTSRTKGTCVQVYDATHLLAEEFVRLQHEQTDLGTEIGKAMNTASAALNSVGTIQKLITIWPEVEEFAKEFLVDGEQKAILPAIPRAELNAALGLPPGASA